MNSGILGPPFDAGDTRFGQYAISLEPLMDCPVNAVFMDSYYVGLEGKPENLSNLFCIFEISMHDILT